MAAHPLQIAPTAETRLSGSDRRMRLALKLGRQRPHRQLVSALAPLIEVPTIEN
jgi:hypothetical protein